MLLRQAAAACAALLLAACSGERVATEDDVRQAAFLPDSVLIERGSAAANRLAGGLLAPLSASVQQHGAAGAVDFCSREALRLTAAIQDSIGRDVRIGRTTLRWRNAANAPDSIDREVLQAFEAAAIVGDSVPAYRLVHDGEVARFYRPLRIQPLCLQCHGGEGELDPEVKQILERRYPDDLATGYGAGDVRGAIRVVLPRTPVH